jgi:hypothetical protein
MMRKKKKPFASLALCTASHTQLASPIHNIFAALGAHKSEGDQTESERRRPASLSKQGEMRTSLSKL